MTWVCKEGKSMSAVSLNRDTVQYVEDYITPFSSAFMGCHLTVIDFAQKMAIAILWFICLVLSPWSLGGANARILTIGAAQVENSERYVNLDAFAHAVKCVRPGDKVLLEAGKVFQGSLRLKSCTDNTKLAGTIEVRSFDPGAPLDPSKVKDPARIEVAISARSLGVEWIRLAADQLPATMPQPREGMAIFKLRPLSRDVSELFYGGKRLLLARTPSEPVNGVGSRFARTNRITTSQTSCAAIVCLSSSDAAILQTLQKAASEQSSLEGGYAVIRNSPWSLARSKVAGIDANIGEIRLSDRIFGEGMPTNTLPPAGYGFVLLNSPAFMDSSGEWYYDKSSRSLYILWDADSGPLAQQTQLVFSSPADSDKFVHEDAALSFWGNPNGKDDSYTLSISHLAIGHSAGHGVRVFHVPRLSLVDITVEHPHQSGIAVHGVQESVEIIASSVIDAPGNGITVSSAKVVRIESNRLSRTGYIANQDRFDMDFNGIRAGGFQSILVARNEITAAGYAGVVLSEPLATRQDDSDIAMIEVVDNHISDFCRLLNDCGAIYIDGHQNGGSKAKLGPVTTKRISGNDIRIPGGNLDGAPGFYASPNEPKSKNGESVRMVGGVYLDHGASGYDIYHNKVAGKYEPYEWRIFNRGLFNSCNRNKVTECGDTKSAYQCYTKALDGCNAVSATQ
jgi:hypothetical protein